MNHLPANIRKKCQYLRNRLTRAKQVLRSINVEIRGLNPADTPPWEAKAREFEDRINKLSQDVEWAETATQNTKGGEAPKRNIDDMTTQEITKHALKVQDKTQESTARAKKALEETIEVFVLTG